LTVELQMGALDELEQTLESCSLYMRGIRVVTDTLPGRAICTATIVDGVLWLVLDLDKPSAPRHAVVMIREAAARLHLDKAARLPCPRPFSERPALALVS
jgi:hypothetical protein